MDDACRGSLVTTAVYVECRRRLRALAWPMVAVWFAAAFWLLGIATDALSIVGWIIATATGRVPRSLVRIQIMCLGPYQRFLMFVMLLTDEIPLWSDPSGMYPSRIRVTPPKKLGRVDVLTRGLIALPVVLVVVTLVLGWPLYTVSYWLTVLLKGELPRFLFDAGFFLVRRALNLKAYVLLLTDDIPLKFSGSAGDTVVFVRDGVCVTEFPKLSLVSYFVVTAILLCGLFTELGCLWALVFWS